MKRDEPLGSQGGNVEPDQMDGWVVRDEHLYGFRSRVVGKVVYLGRSSHGMMSI